MNKVKIFGDTYSSHLLKKVFLLKIVSSNVLFTPVKNVNLKKISIEPFGINLGNFSSTTLNVEKVVPLSSQSK